MSYTVLARRYRSRTFDEVVGQEHIAQTLKRAIESERIAHAYLFCGTRGTGKTSMARILAKALNCLKSKGATATPCNECDSCQGIARGDDIDVIEIDAASNTGVDNVRDIIGNSQYRPARSRFKVYIIDEAHMLSKQAFNALLKTLEEPPGHVKFILATTEPEKLLPTILSRCQRYDFRNIPTREIAGHLKQISKQEKIKADEDALLLVAKAGAGSMRDSLSLLDRLLSIGEKHLTVEMIEEMLGLPRAQVIFDLAQVIGQGDAKAVLQQSSKLIAGGLSPDTLIVSLIEHLRNLLVLRTCGKDSELVEVPGLSMDDLVSQAEKFDPTVLTQDIAILEELRRHLRTSQAGRPLFDATLVRLALAEQFTSVADLLAGINGGTPVSASSAALKKNGNVTPSPGQGEGRGEGRSEINANQVARASTPSQLENFDPHPNPPPARGREQDDDDDLPRPGKVWDNSGPSLSELLKQQDAEARRVGTAHHPEEVGDAHPTIESNVEPVSPSDLPGIWKALLDLLATKGPGLPSLLAHGKFIGVESGQAVIRFSQHDATFATMLDRNGKKDWIRNELSGLLNQDVGLTIEIEPTGDAPPPTAAPAARPTTRPVSSAAQIPATPTPPAIRITPELKQSLRDKNPLIAAIMTELGGEIVKVE